MKLSDFREAYYTHSGKASDLVRQLGLAGLGTIWIFKHDSAGKTSVPPELVPIAALIILALALDFLQYVFASIIWGTFTRIQEKKGEESAENLVAPPWLNWPSLACFWAKIGLTVVAYTLLLMYLHSSLA